jgi:hypothetical protein
MLLGPSGAWSVRPFFIASPLLRATISAKPPAASPDPLTCDLQLASVAVSAARRDSASSHPGRAYFSHQGGPAFAPATPKLRPGGRFWLGLRPGHGRFPCRLPPWFCIYICRLEGLRPFRGPESHGKPPNKEAGNSTESTPLSASSHKGRGGRGKGFEGGKGGGGGAGKGQRGKGGKPLPI